MVDFNFVFLKNLFFSLPQKNCHVPQYFDILIDFQNFDVHIFYLHDSLISAVILHFEVDQSATNVAN